jgi:hypothetical protein
MMEWRRRCFLFKLLSATGFTIRIGLTEIQLFLLHHGEGEDKRLL